MNEFWSNLGQATLSVLDGIGRWFSLFSIWAAQALYRGWMPFSQGQLASFIFVLSVLVTCVFFGVVFWTLINWVLDSLKRKPEEEENPEDHRFHQMLETRNGAAYELVYPVVARLTGLNKGLEDTGEFFGYWVKMRPGMAYDTFVFLENSWLRLSTIQSLNHLDIQRIQEEISVGTHDRVDGKLQEIRPEGQFEWNREIWKVDRTYDLQVNIVEGEMGVFAGGKGKVQLRFAAQSGKPEEEQDIICIEKQYHQHRRDINEIWSVYYVDVPTPDEVDAEIGEALESIDLQKEVA